MGLWLCCRKHGDDVSRRSVHDREVPEAHEAALIAHRSEEIIMRFRERADDSIPNRDVVVTSANETARRMERLINRLEQGLT